MRKVDLLDKISDACLGHDESDILSALTAMAGVTLASFVPASALDEAVAMLARQVREQYALMTEDMRS